MKVDGFELIADAGRFLKIEVRGRAVHFIDKAALYVIRASAEYIHQFLNHEAIFIARHRPNARRVAKLDIVETGKRGRPCR